MDSQISIVIAERCLPGAQGLDPDFGPLGGTISGEGPSGPTLAT